MKRTKKPGHTMIALSLGSAAALTLHFLAHRADRTPSYNFDTHAIIYETTSNYKRLLDTEAGSAFLGESAALICEARALSYIATIGMNPQRTLTLEERASFDRGRIALHSLLSGFRQLEVPRSDSDFETQIRKDIDTSVALLERLMLQYNNRQIELSLMADAYEIMTIPIASIHGISAVAKEQSPEEVDQRLLASSSSYRLARHADCLSGPANNLLDADVIFAQAWMLRGFGADCFEPGDWEMAWVVVDQSYNSYETATNAASDISAKFDIPYSTLGMRDVSLGWPSLDSCDSLRGCAPKPLSHGIGVYASVWKRKDDFVVFIAVGRDQDPSLVEISKHANLNGLHTSVERHITYIH